MAISESEFTSEYSTNVAGAQPLSFDNVWYARWVEEQARIEEEARAARADEARRRESELRRLLDEHMEKKQMTQVSHGYNHYVQTDNITIYTCEKCKEVKGDMAEVVLYDLKFYLCRSCYNDVITHFVKHESAIFLASQQYMLGTNSHTPLSQGQGPIVREIFETIAKNMDRIRREIMTYVEDKKVEIGKRKEMTGG